jgi:hypothetical protein
VVCYNCGVRLPDGAPQCGTCGARQSRRAPAPEQTIAAAPPAQPQAPYGYPASNQAPIQGWQQPPPQSQGWQQPPQQQAAPPWQQSAAPAPYPSPYPSSYPGYGPPVQAQRAASTTGGQAAVVAALLLALGGGLVIAFLFLPWLTVSSLGSSESLSFKDFVDESEASKAYIGIVVAVGCVAFLAALLRLAAGANQGFARAVAGCAAGGAAVETAHQILAFRDFTEGGPPVDVGLGFYALGLACVVLLAGALIERSAPAGR